MDLDAITPVTETRTVEGIRLPYEIRRQMIYGDPASEVVTDSGEVFIEQELLTELGEQDRWDSMQGKVFLINDPRQAAALEGAGLAEQETRGGYHRTDVLMTLLRRLGW